MDIETAVDGYIAITPTLAHGVTQRLGYWASVFAGRDITTITPDEVDEAITQLVQRGQCRPGKNNGKPYAPATVDRFVADLSSLYRFCRKNRIIPRNFVPPTHGIGKQGEVVHHDRYFSREQVEQLAKVARITDLNWRKLPALIWVAYTTGLRKSNIKNLRWRDVDFINNTIIVGKTKNGEPMHSPLTEQAAKELLKLRDPREPDAYIFCGYNHPQPFDWRCQWAKAVKAAGLSHLTFHALRHGCGHALALSGESQSMIMRYMGHRSLSASARYMHASMTDKQRVASRAFS